MSVALVARDEKGKPDFVADVSVLRVQPGDLVILSTPGAISDESARRLKEYFEHWALPADIKVAIMGDGLHVDRVIRPTS